MGTLSRHCADTDTQRCKLYICIQSPADLEKEVKPLFIALALFDGGDLKQTARVEGETPERLMRSELTQNKTGSQRDQRVKCMYGCAIRCSVTLNRNLRKSPSAAVSCARSCAQKSN